MLNKWFIYKWMYTLKPVVQGEMLKFSYNYPFLDLTFSVSSFTSKHTYRPVYEIEKYEQ